MPYYVYVIQSEKDGSFYKGFSEHPLVRLGQHNNQESTYTSTRIPWRLVYLEKYASKSDALRREKSIKKYSHNQLKELIDGPKNHLSSFMDESLAG